MKQWFKTRVLVSLMLLGCVFALLLSAPGAQAAEGDALAFSSAPALPGGMLGAPYTAAITVTGGVAPYTYSMTGALPAGLQLDVHSGVISGTPRAHGHYPSVFVTVTDAAGDEITATFHMDITATPVDVEYFDLTYTYDGSEKAAGVRVFVDGVETTTLDYQLLYNSRRNLPIDAGTYIVSMRLPAGYYLRNGPKRATLSIYAAQGASLALTGAMTRDYNGLPQEVGVTAVPAQMDYTVTYYDPDGTVRTAPPVEPGSYPVAARSTSGNYSVSAATGTLVIRGVPVEATFSNTTVAYADGAALALGDGDVAFTFPGEGAYTRPAYTIQYRLPDGTLADTVSEVGSYPIVLTLADSAARYELQRVTPAQFTVTKRTLAFSMTAGAVQTYTGAPLFPQLGCDAPEGTSVDYTVTYFDASGTAVDQPAEEGEYTVHITVSPDDPHYTFDGDLKDKFIIAPQGLVNVALADCDQVYDGSGKGVRVAATDPEGYEDDIEITGYTDAAGNFVADPVDAGTYTVIAALKGTGPAARSGEEDQPSAVGVVHPGALVIHPLDVSFTLGASSASYTGSRIQPDIRSSVSLPEGSYDVRYLKDGADVGEIREAGTYTLVLSLKSGNYSLKSGGSLTFQVEPQTVSFTADELTKVYNGQPQQPVLTAPEGVSEPYTLSFKDLKTGAVTAAVTHAGSYQVLASFAGGSYVQDASPIQFTITPKSVTFALTQDRAPYTGAAVVPALTHDDQPDLQEGDWSVSYRLGGRSLSEIRSVGDYVVEVKLLNGDYVLADSQPQLDFTIYQRDSIELSPGNSPAGRIQGGSGTDSEKAAALAEFLNTRSYLGVKYNAEAWSGLDLDADPTALILYRLADFSEPGFLAWNSDGTPAASDGVQVVIKGLEAPTGGALAGLENLHALGDIPATAQALAGVNAAPGIYSIEYTFTDTDGTIHTASRRLVLLPELGDANLDGHVNALDVNALRVGAQTLLAGLDEARAALLLWRVWDADRSGAVDLLDQTAIQERLRSPITPFYPWAG